ncbi:hypothetical protein [Desulfoferrobacter suflitae]|uniref:hypothetical protein n=1 Tax=Desulfoferrobacter suflitae TaxID=2865782 RepID=UPI0021645E8E|nr:hypothetical protein [Desulfoferrobacter suflitae]MCK8603651.1 hypothetical protein [Desulfoferrobacter suflitae]
MATDVAEFARQLRQDGIDAAQSEAQKIIAEARATAEQTTTEAKLSAQKMLAEAEQEIARKFQRSEAELKLAARDIMLKLKRQIEQIVQDLLKEKTGKVLSCEQVIKSAVMEVIKSQKTGSDWELALGPSVGEPLAKAVVDEFCQSEHSQMKLVDGFNKAGFQLKSKVGSEVIEVSDDSMAEAFRRLLSPELQRILNSKIEAAE